MSAEKLILRPINTYDQPKILEVLTSNQVNKTYILPDYETKQKAIPLFHRLMDLSEDPARYVRCIGLDDTPIGFINDVEIADRAIELGYVIHPDYHNHGYMTMALTAAIGELFGIGYDCVICGAFEENRASIRVMEKCAMTRMDKTETISYRDREHLCVYYQIKKEEASC